MRAQPSLTDIRVWLLPSACVAVFALLLVTNGNLPAFRLLNGLGALTGERFWALVTVFGDTVVAATLCLALLPWRRGLMVAVAPAALACTAWIHVLKPLVDSDRPLGMLPAQTVHVIGPAYHYHSFPSGHAATAFLVAGLLVQGWRLRTLAWLPVGAALLVAISRSAVGVHWPLDTLAGAFGGWVSAFLGLRAAAWIPSGTSALLTRLVALALAGCAVALLAGYDTRYPQALGLMHALALSCLAAGALALLRRRF